MFIAIGLLHQVTDSSSGRPENDSGSNNNSYEGEQQGNDLHTEQSAEEELDMVSPDQLLDWMETSGAAVYYGNTGKLAYVSVIFQSARWNGEILPPYFKQCL